MSATECTDIQTVVATDFKCDIQSCRHGPMCSTQDCFLIHYSNELCCNENCVNPNCIFVHRLRATYYAINYHNKSRICSYGEHIDFTIKTLSSLICKMADKEIKKSYKERMIRCILTCDLNLYEPSKYQDNLKAFCAVDWTDFDCEFDMIFSSPLFLAKQQMSCPWKLCTQPVNLVTSYLKYFGRSVNWLLECLDENAVFNIDAIKFITMQYPDLIFSCNFLEIADQEIIKVIVDHALRNRDLRSQENAIRMYLSYAISNSHTDIFDLMCKPEYADKITNILIFTLSHEYVFVTDITIFDRIVEFFPNVLHKMSVLTNIIRIFGNDVETYKKFSKLGIFSGEKIFQDFHENWFTLKEFLLNYSDQLEISAECIDYITNCT